MKAVVLGVSYCGHGPCGNTLTLNGSRYSRIDSELCQSPRPYINALRLVGRAAGTIRLWFKFAIV